MRYDPEAANADLIPSDTWLEALIVSSEDKVSKQGNEMIQVGFKIYDDAGKQPTITDYYVSSKPGKFKKLCNVLNLPFDSGEIEAEELLNKSLWVLVKIQKDDKYGDKNVIAAFSDTMPEGASANNTAHASRTAEDDGIPF